MLGIKFLFRAIRVSLLLLLLGGGYAKCTCDGVACGGDVPSPPRMVVDEYLKLITARPVSVEVLRSSPPADLPYARVRLLVTNSLDGPIWRGVDARAFRDAGLVSRLELSVPAGAFRDRLDRVLRASSAGSGAPSDEAFRTVDVWCVNTSLGGSYTPLLVKVWDDREPDRRDGRRTPKTVLGQLCHAEVPFVTESQAAFDYQPTLLDTGMNKLSYAPETAELMALAIGNRRLESETAARNAQGAGEARSAPMPGGIGIELTGFGDLPADLCRHEGTISRIEGDHAYLGLADGVTEGSCLLSFKTPFPIGGAAMMAAFETLDRSSSIEVDASTDESNAGTWKPVLRLGDRPMRQRDQWVLPSAVSGGSGLRLRVRIKSAAIGARSDGPRAFLHRLDVPIRHRLVEESGVLRLVELPAPMTYASARRPALQVVAQRDRLGSADLVAMLNRAENDIGRREMIDIYAPCELDATSCSAIAQHAGTIRFWAAAPWQESPPACLDLLVSGTGSIVFPRLPKITEPLAAVVGGGGKSLAFPAVKTVDAVVLGLLARCAGDVAIDGLERLTAEQSAALGRYEGPRLSLTGARDVSVAGIPSKVFLRAAVSSPGTLVVQDAAAIDDSIADILARGRKHLVLDGITELSPQVAAALASARGGLSLDGVVSLDRKSTRSLLTYAGAFLSLRGLRRAECRIDDLAAVGNAVSSGGLMHVIAPYAAEASEDATPADATQRPQDVMAGEHDVSQVPSRLWMSPPDVTAIDAVLQSPGSFRLEPSQGNMIRPLDAATVAVLTRGEKDLDLDAFATIAPDAFQALCRSRKIASMGGLREIPDGCLPDVCNHSCKRLYLDGIGSLEEKQIEDLLTLIEQDRISLTGAGIYNILALRAYAMRPETEKELQRPDADAIKQFLDRSKIDDWTGTNRYDKFRAIACLLSPDKVVFETSDGEKLPTRKRDATGLSKNSLNKLDTLEAAARKVSDARRRSLFSPQEAGNPPALR